jgi:DNA-binding winged helix-turn-helix (wHTH) protein/Tfp pilus assembly protein PilF
MSLIEFGPFRLDVTRLVLTHDGVPVALGPRVVATLCALAERPGEVVTKAELLDRVWPDEDVGEANLTQSVYVLRKAMRAHGIERSIETVPRRGYRLVVPVWSKAATDPSVRAPADTSSWHAAWRYGTALSFALLLALTAAGPRHRPPAAHPALSALGAERYKLARYFWNLRTPAGLAKSAELFAGVTRTDPRNSLGYSGLADADLMIADYSEQRARARVFEAHARTNVARALALDPGSAEAHAALAMLRFNVDHDAPGSDREFRRAIALDPWSAVAHHWYGATLLEEDHVREARRQLRLAAELDPATPATSDWLALASYYERRYADAIHYGRIALDLDPSRHDVPRNLGLAYEAAGDLRDAIAIFERLENSRAGDDRAEAAALLAEAYARAGRAGAARASLEVALRADSRDFDTAIALLACGRRERALRLLRSLRGPTNTPERAYMIEDPRLDPIRSALISAKGLRTTG